jgi:hypothetical protein
MLFSHISAAGSAFPDPPQTLTDSLAPLPRPAASPGAASYLVPRRRRRLTNHYHYNIGRCGMAKTLFRKRKRCVECVGVSVWVMPVWGSAVCAARVGVMCVSCFQYLIMPPHASS